MINQSIMAYNNNVRLTNALLASVAAQGLKMNNFVGMESLSPPMLEPENLSTSPGTGTIDGIGVNMNMEAESYGTAPPETESNGMMAAAAAAAAGSNTEVRTPGKRVVNGMQIMDRLLRSMLEAPPLSSTQTGRKNNPRALRGPDPASIAGTGLEKRSYWLYI